jgi:hypothetical protein
MDIVEAIDIAINAMEDESHRLETVSHSASYIAELGEAVDALYKLLDEINGKVPVTKEDK